MSKPGEDLRERGIAKAEKGSNAYWTQVAAYGVRAIAQSGADFTADAVWSFVEHFAPEAKTPEPRAMGAIMRSAQRAGFIEPTDQWRLSARPQSHRRPVRVWRPVPEVPND